MATRRDRNQKRTSARGPAELGVAPHGGSKVIEMPIRTDQRGETKGQNVVRTPSTRSGRLASSVAKAKVARMGRRGNKVSSVAAGKSQHKTVETSTKKNTRNTA